jgi:hypothetical protein
LRKLSMRSIQIWVLDGSPGYARRASFGLKD